MLAQQLGVRPHRRERDREDGAADGIAVCSVIHGWVLCEIRGGRCDVSDTRSQGLPSPSNDKKLMHDANFRSDVLS